MGGNNLICPPRWQKKTVTTASEFVPFADSRSPQRYEGESNDGTTFPSNLMNLDINAHPLSYPMTRKKERQRFPLAESRSTGWRLSIVRSLAFWFCFFWRQESEKKAPLSFLLVEQLYQNRSVEDSTGYSASRFTIACPFIVFREVHVMSKKELLPL